MKQRILPIIVLFCVSILTNASAQQTLQKVYVVNEGNFGQGNASITAYNLSDGTGTTTTNAFYKKNGLLLGDVAQSSTIINDKIYVLVYGNSRIFVADRNTLALDKTISYDAGKEKGPRQMVAVGSNKAYVTNLDSKNISIIDLTTNGLTGSIKLTSGPEGIAVSNGKAYAALNDLGEGDSLAVIDTQKDKVIKKIKVGDNPVDVAADNQGRVWVVCVGNYGYDSQGNYDPNLVTYGKIVVINSSDDTITKTIDVGGHPGDIALLPSLNRAYYNNGGIVSIDMKNLTALSDTLVKGSYYAMDVARDDQKPQLFVADAADYISSGTVINYDLTTTLPQKVTSFSAGIIPGAFGFVYSGSPLAVEPSTSKPETFALMQNYPNPFNPTTTIRYRLSGSGNVELSVYNITGSLVSKLVDTRQSEGEHSVRFDASKLSSGIYFYWLQFNGQTHIKKMILIK